VLRDRGMITLSYVFDTLGDSAPGGVFLEDPVVVVRVHLHMSFGVRLDVSVLAPGERSCSPVMRPSSDW
jgi:hypothetical protein